MKKEITLYRDNDYNDIYTEMQLESLYETSRYATIYYNFYDFLITKIDTGCFEEITATLSDGTMAYPYYYIEDNETVLTIMQLYMEWENNYDCRNFETFADFLNIPQEDRNAIMFYGFE